VSQNPHPSSLPRKRGREDLDITLARHILSRAAMVPVKLKAHVFPPTLAGEG